MPDTARRTALAFAITAGLAASASAATPPARPWMDRSLSADRRAELVVAAMTDDEKFRLIRSDFGLASDKHGVPEGAVSGAGYVPALPRLGLPAINETDAGLGVNKPGIDGKGAISLPAGLATAASFDTAVAHAGGRMIGGEARGKGYGVLLSGGVNLVRDPRNGRNFEYAGEDPILAGSIVGATIKGIQEQKIVATTKHYAINDLESGRNTLSADIDPVALRESDLLAFQIAIAHGDPGSVMSSYNRVNGTFAGEHDWLLNQVLKQEWGFKGFVMSDWGGVHSGAKAALAGLDQESAGEVFDAEVFFDKPLRAAVASGDVPKSRLDDMARRIMRSLIAHGVIDDPIPTKPTTPVPYDADRKVARDTLEAGAVLLRNEAGLLPLSREGQSVVVIGAHADKGVLAGGGSSTVTDEGGDPVPGLQPTGWPGPVRYHASAPLTFMQKLGAKVSFDPGTDPAAAAKAAAGADVAVVFVTQWAAESFDVPDMALPDGQDALVAAVAKANPKTVVVLETNGAVKMPWLDSVGAVLQAWYPGSGGGEGIARLLYGETSPSGRLPVSWPKDEAQLPRPTIQGAGLYSKEKPADNVDYNIEGADVGYRWFEKTRREPLFAFGYGLTYTNFAYSDFAVDKDNKGHVVAHVTVKNTGKTAAADVPQIYVTAPGAATRRLAGWSKVALKPGASRRVNIPLESLALARYDDAGKRWRVAPGTYAVKLGRSASDIAAEATVTVGESFPVVKAPEGLHDTATSDSHNARMNLRPAPIVAALLCLASAPAFADPPDFDRPGAGFATSVLPVGTLALEQGLPTYERQRQDGVLDKTYTADSLIRIGLGGPAELQLGGSAWNRLEERGDGSRRHATGHGDTSVGLKIAPGGSGDTGTFSWAALGQVSFANGDKDFSNGAKQYTLGATGQWKPNETWQGTLFANVDHLQGKNTWTLAPTFGRKFGENWMAYVETDAIHDAEDGNELQAGGGVAYSIGDHAQLDAYALHRIGSHGPSVVAGLGVSVFFGKKS